MDIYCLLKMCLEVGDLRFAWAAQGSHQDQAFPGFLLYPSYVSFLASGLSLRDDQMGAITPDITYIFTA